MAEEKRSDRRQSGSIFLAGNFGFCSEIVGVLAWRYEHRIRRQEDLLFSFGSERRPFPKDGPGHLDCRPSLSPTWRISPGCPWIKNFRGFGIRFDNTFFAAPAWIILFVCFLLSCPCVDLDKHSFFFYRFTGIVCQEELTPFPSSPTAFRLLSHTLTPIFYTSVTAPCSAGVHKATVHICMQKPRSESEQLTRASTSVPVLCDSSTEPPAWCSSSQTTELHPSSVF